MNLLKIIISFALIFCSSLIFAQTSKKVPQIHTMPSETKTILIEIPSNRVEIVKVKGTRISIEANVRLGSGTAPLLDYLVSSGRYELKAIVDPQTNTLTLTPQKDQKVVIIKGEECPEVVTYLIHIPETIQYVETLGASQINFIAHH